MQFGLIESTCFRIFWREVGVSFLCDIFLVQFYILDAAEVLSASLSWINKDWSVIANVTIFMVRCLLRDYFFLNELHLSFCRQLKKIEDQDRKSG